MIYYVASKRSAREFRFKSKAAACAFAKLRNGYGVGRVAQVFKAGKKAGGAMREVSCSFRGKSARSFRGKSARFGGYLHTRAAKVLGWSVRDAESMSLQSLREMVRTVDPDLAKEITESIRSGSYIRGKVAADMSWLGPPPPKKLGGMRRSYAHVPNLTIPLRRALLKVGNAGIGHPGTSRKVERLLRWGLIRKVRNTAGYEVTPKGWKSIGEN